MAMHSVLSTVVVFEADIQQWGSLKKLQVGDQGKDRHFFRFEEKQLE
jgi:hypothetical protein